MCEAKKRRKYDSRLFNKEPTTPTKNPRPHTQFQFSCHVICVDNLYARQAHIYICVYI